MGLEEIARCLPEPFRLLWRDQVGSTNDELRQLAEQGAADGLILGADVQTAGRGRRGRVWFSKGAEAEALTFSILLRPSEDREYWSRYALMAGLAVAEALGQMGVAAEIKWPNDVFVGGKKIAGILVEAGGDYLVIGIGLNVNDEEFPDQLEATSLSLELGSGQARGDVLANVVQQMGLLRSMSKDGFPVILREVRRRDCLEGKQVSFLVNDVPQEGYAAGIGDRGGLLIERNGQSEEIFQADQVRVI